MNAACRAIRNHCVPYPAAGSDEQDGCLKFSARMQNADAADAWIAQRHGMSNMEKKAPID